MQSLVLSRQILRSCSRKIFCPKIRLDSTVEMSISTATVGTNQANLIDPSGEVGGGLVAGASGGAGWERADLHQWRRHRGRFRKRGKCRYPAPIRRDRLNCALVFLWFGTGRSSHHSDTKVNKRPPRKPLCRWLHNSCTNDAEQG